MTEPRVSVICIFLNEEKFLAEAIESVLAQEFEDWELLLVDDGSTDGSTRIALDYAARHRGRIVYLEHPGHVNRGMSASRNLGLAGARGEFVAVLDGDDCWLPGKLAGQVALFDADPEIGMVSGGHVEWRSWAGGKDESWLSGPVTEGKTYPPQATLGVYPLGRAGDPTAPMIRRSVAEEVGGWEEAFPGLYEDQAFLAKVYLATPVYWSRQIWLKYRRHTGGTMAWIAWVDYAATRTRFLDWFEGYVAGRDLPGRPAVERAIRDYSNSLKRSIPDEFWPHLRKFEIPQDDIPTDAMHQEMLLLLHIFEYMNGRPWYEVNPVLRTLHKYRA